MNPSDHFITRYGERVRLKSVDCRRCGHDLWAHIVEGEPHELDPSIPGEGEVTCPVDGCDCREDW